MKIELTPSQREHRRRATPSTATDNVRSHIVEGSGTAVNSNIGRADSVPKFRELNVNPTVLFGVAVM